MKTELLYSMICPVCHKGFKLKVFREKDKEIEEGILICSCGQFFPIVNKIPRILIGGLRVVLYNDFPEFFLKYKKFLPNENILKKNNEMEILQKRKTLQSFGYEWNKFSETLKEWKENFNFYFEPLKNFNLLKNKIILEAGCGQGRHTHYVAELAKEVISIDASKAIDVALYNTKKFNNIHFIQADIYNLPFKKNFFDFIFSLGVLHHLPRPEEGFKKIVEFLKFNGNVLIYVYHSFPKNDFRYYGLKLINIPRSLTVKLPFSILYLFCWPIALLLYSIFVLPYKFLSNFLKIKKIKKINWPFNLYSVYPFYVLLNDTFDRFSAPIENRYSKKQVLDWYQRAGLRDIKILKGWRILGKKVNF